MKSKTIVFFGTDKYSLIALEKLFKAGYSIGAIVTKPDSKSGRGHKISAPIVKEFGLKNNIPVLQPEKVSDINEYISKLGNSLIGVLVSFGKIIPKSTIDLFNPAILNIHPSLLPKYRGSSPIESAIANGDKETGISIMGLTSKMDAGPVYGQIKIDLNGTETKPELYETLFGLGADELLNKIDSISEGLVEPYLQNENEVSFCGQFSKQDAYIDPTKISSQKAEQLVRAYLGFPRTKINLLGKEIIITKSHVSESKITEADIAFSDGKYLSIDELISPNGKTVSAKDFLNGYR